MKKQIIVTLILASLVTPQAYAVQMSEPKDCASENTNTYKPDGDGEAVENKDGDKDQSQEAK